MHIEDYLNLKKVSLKELIIMLDLKAGSITLQIEEEKFIAEKCLLLALLKIN